jgi:alkanesulfonate monooxygenase SsuD/methylene tetrahydromethanopterin reductase-like flavin-dependent oxidoreductase (luciferase family)
MLAIALPHVDAWNTWFTSFGNRAEGFALLNAQIDAACERVGREPRAVDRSACLFVQIDGGAGERMVSPDAPPLALEAVAAELQALAEAGADEAILVVDPSAEESIRALGAVLATTGHRDG